MHKGIGRIKYARMHLMTAFLEGIVLRKRALLGALGLVPIVTFGVIFGQQVKAGESQPENASIPVAASSAERAAASTAQGWNFRRVVVATDNNNEAYFARDEAIPAGWPGKTAIYKAWGEDTLPIRLPTDGRAPALTEGATSATAPEMIKRSSWLPKPNGSGYRVFWYEFGPQYKSTNTTPWHWHDSTEIWSIAEGEVVIILPGGKERTLHRGETVVVTGINHRWENRSGKSAVASVVSLSSARTGARPGAGEDMTADMTTPEPAK